MNRERMEYNRRSSDFEIDTGEDLSMEAQQRLGALALDKHENSNSNKTIQALAECSPKTREIWDSYAERLDHAWAEHAEQGRMKPAVWRELEEKAASTLREVPEGEEREKFQRFLAERHRVRTIDDTESQHEHYEITDGLRKIANCCENYDPMLSGALQQAHKLFIEEDNPNHEVLKLPLKALVEMMSDEERERYGVTAEKERVERVTKGFEKLLEEIDWETSDVAWDCRKLALEDDYENLVSAYATMAFYTSAHQFDKNEIYDKIRDGEAKYETDDGLGFGGDYVTKVDLSKIVNEDILYDLPMEEFRKNHYDDLQKIMHCAHLLYPRLHPDAMLNYAQLAAVMTFGEENAEKVYTDEATIPDSDRLGLNGKDDVPEGVRQFLYDLARREGYDDIAITDVGMSWVNSHWENGPEYDYSVAELVRYNLAGNNQEVLQNFVEAVNRESGQLIDSMLTKE